MAYLTAAEVKTLIGTKASNWDDDRIERLIARFETMVEGPDVLNCAFQERERTWTAPACQGWSRVLILPDLFIREITSVTADGVAWTEDQLADLTVDTDTGVIHHAAGWSWTGPLVVTYTYGLDAPPQAVLDACVDFVRVKYLAQTTNRDKRIEAYDDDSGYSYTIGTPDPANGRYTGIPPVDQALAEVPHHRMPSIA